MNNDEFYIGWMEKSPCGFAMYLKKRLLVLIVFVATAAALLALAQKKFGSGNFEFGKRTEVKGIYFNKPFPFLKAVNGTDIFGHPCFITIPLIGFGKLGAEGTIAAIEQQKKLSLNHTEVTLTGTLLYNDGKLLMQIDSNDSTTLKLVGKQADSHLLPDIDNLGLQEIHGEIVDPKCFFGVMKPGEGKPHKDCAIRCILGGIPPVLKVLDEKGNENYYLLAGPNGEPINEAVQRFVAAPVTVRAKVIKYDDWILLYVQTNGITPFSYLRTHYGNAIVLCNPKQMN